MNARKLPEWESAIDKQIREAQQRGDFDNLPGAGKPLTDEPWEGEWAMAYHVLKQAGETLPWILLGREIEATQERVRRRLEQARTLAPEQRSLARQRFLQEAEALDKLLEEYAFMVPIRSLERGRFPRHVAEQQFDAACGP